jgi:GDP-L-fucose synthase
MKQKILICGASGFIGRNLVEFYSKKPEYEVFGTYLKSQPYNLPGLKLIKVDLQNKTEVEAALKGKEIIIQAAATTSGAKDITNTPYLHVTDNAIMNSLIFRSAHEQNIPHIIFFSCTVMYQPGEKPVKEDDFDANKEMYHNYFGAGWTKVYLEKQAEFYSRLSRTKYTVIRHSNVYGPHDKYDLDKSHVFGATIAKVMTNTDKKIVVWGTGEAARDLIHVNDLVRFVDLAVQKQEKPFGLYNVGMGKAVTVRSLVKKIIEISGKEITVEYDLKKPNFTTKLCVDYTKAKETFNWEPQISLENGIKQTIKWYKKNEK